MATDLTHLDSEGHAHMVDVGDKEKTERTATVSGFVWMEPTTLEAILDGDVPKGDVIAVARVAGIMGAKKTAGIIPLCHPLSITSIEVEIQPVRSYSEDTRDGLCIEATVTTNDRTGVEMEAFTAVSVTALTIYDMCKAIDRTMVISDILLEHKAGGKSGEFTRENEGRACDRHAHAHAHAHRSLNKETGQFV